MKKMQKEMKDVELQLGIVANQVRFDLPVHSCRTSNPFRCLSFSERAKKKWIARMTAGTALKMICEIAVPFAFWLQ